MQPEGVATGRVAPEVRPRRRARPARRRPRTPARRPVRSCMAQTSGSAPLRTGRHRRHALDGSPLAWAIAPARRTHRRGRADVEHHPDGRGRCRTGRRRRPAPAPISATRYRVRSSIRVTVSGTPSSLLRLPTRATVGPAVSSTWLSRSLVEVLPQAGDADDPQPVGGGGRPGGGPTGPTRPAGPRPPDTGRPGPDAGSARRPPRRRRRWGRSRGRRPGRRAGRRTVPRA